MDRKIKISGLNIIAAIAGIAFAMVFALNSGAQKMPADFDSLEPANKPIVIQGNTLSAICDTSLIQYQTTRKLKVIVTGYSSTPDQTDSDPYITASGSYVRQGIVAANFLPFGTKVRFPEVYGDKVFVVEDRMHPRKRYQVDIWFPSREQALNFGAKILDLEIIQQN